MAQSVGSSGAPAATAAHRSHQVRCFWWHGALAAGEHLQQRQHTTHIRLLLRLERLSPEPNCKLSVRSFAPRFITSQPGLIHVFMLLLQQLTDRFWTLLKQGLVLHSSHASHKVLFYIPHTPHTPASLLGTRCHHSSTSAVSRSCLAFLALLTHPHHCSALIATTRFKVLDTVERRALERMMRHLLNLPHSPAVIMFHAWSPTSPEGGTLGPGRRGGGGAGTLGPGRRGGGGGG